MPDESLDPAAMIREEDKENKEIRARQLKEDKELLVRLSKKPARKCYYVDVDNIPPNEVGDYIKNIAKGLKGKFGRNIEKHEGLRGVSDKDNA